MPNITPLRVIFSPKMRLILHACVRVNYASPCLNHKSLQIQLRNGASTQPEETSTGLPPATVKSTKYMTEKNGSRVENFAAR